MTDERAQQPDLDAEWEELARFLAGESSPEEQRRLRVRLARDPERAALVQALDAALTPPDDTPLAVEEVERALASVMARRDPVAPRIATPPGVIPLRGRPATRLADVRSRWRRAGLQAAAAVIVVAGASLLWKVARTTDESAPAVKVPDVEYATAVGRIDTLKLVDGTSVVLGPSSRIRLASGYGGRSRELTLDGQAFFDVVHDDARPFVVRTTSATLRDVGTSFSVESDMDLGTRVAVTSGAVDVAALAAGDQEPTVLHGGDRAEVRGERMTVERGVVGGDALAWTHGALTFHDASMATVASELRRWYGIRLVIADSALAARRLTATFDRVSTDDVGRVLAAVLGGSVSRSATRSGWAHEHPLGEQAEMRLKALDRRATRTAVATVIAVAIAARAGAQPAHPCSDAGTELVASVGTWTGPLAAVVSLHARGLSLRDALDRLGAQSGVPLAYSSDVLPLDRPVCVVAERQPLGRVLATLLEGTNVEALVVAGKVVLAPAVGTRPHETSKVSVLERVIVTGSAIGATRRPLAVGVEVIDGDEIRRSSYSDLASALDTYVPGLWLWAQSSGSLVARYGGVRGASSFSTSYPKMYIDGIQVANPLLVTQLNPDAVDRVEVIRGPQGSALYGSDAISGVINVITRHDGTPPSGARLRVSSLAGASGSDYGTRPVPTHDQRISLRSGTNLGSAGLSLEFGQTGAFFPSAQSRQLSILGDGRRVTSNATLSGTARLFDRRAGVGNNPLLAGLGTPWVDTSGAYPGSGGSGGPGSGGFDDRRAPPMPRDGDQHVRLYTLGGSATFATRGVWTHTLVAGVDGYQLDNVADATNPFEDGVDATRAGATGGGDRTTLRASSVAQVGGQSAIPATTITLSVEHSVLRQRNSVTNVVAPGQGERYSTAVDGIARLRNHNSGALVQASTAWRDALFVTGGVRLERNDAFSGNDRYPVLPLLGAALVRAFGPVEMKLRSSYGKGIRPFQTPERLGWSEYGPVNSSRTGLDPEVQTGIENGIELYLGGLLSLQATRFDQRATGLIQNVAIAVDTQLRGGSLERRMRFQLENVGEITNRGWEMQAGLKRGALGVSGTVTTVDSRVRAVADGYLGDLRAGDRMLAVPARTSSLSGSWTEPRWTLALTATRAEDWVNYDRIALARAYTGADGAQRDVTGSRLRSYWRDYTGQTHLRISTSRDVGRGLTLLMIGDNLMGGQVGEPDNLTIRQGRTLSGGLRASF